MGAACFKSQAPPVSERAEDFQAPVTVSVVDSEGVPSARDRRESCSPPSALDIPPTSHVPPTSQSSTADPHTLWPAQAETDYDIDSLQHDPEGHQALGLLSSTSNTPPLRACTPEPSNGLDRFSEEPGLIDLIMMPSTSSTSTPRKATAAASDFKLGPHSPTTIFMPAHSAARIDPDRTNCACTAGFSPQAGSPSISLPGSFPEWAQHAHAPSIANILESSGSSMSIIPVTVGTTLDSQPSESADRSEAPAAAASALNLAREIDRTGWAALVDEKLKRAPEVKVLAASTDSEIIPQASNSDGSFESQNGDVRTGPEVAAAAPATPPRDSESHSPSIRVRRSTGPQSENYHRAYEFFTERESIKLNMPRYATHGWAPFMQMDGY